MVGGGAFWVAGVPLVFVSARQPSGVQIDRVGLVDRGDGSLQGPRNQALNADRASDGFSRFFLRFAIAVGCSCRCLSPGIGRLS